MGGGNGCCRLRLLAGGAYSPAAVLWYPITRFVGQLTICIWTLRVSLCYINSTVFHKPNPSSGVPIYVQLKDQVRHAIETGALSLGDQLPGIRTLAEALVVNPNTVIRVYRELEQEGALEIRHGLGAFVASRRQTSHQAERMRDAQRIVAEVIDQLRDHGLGDGEIRRMVDAELMQAPELQRR